MNLELTQQFQLNHEGKNEVRQTIDEVFSILEGKGYNSLSQLTGYLISGDPAFIPRYKDARIKVTRLSREEIIEELICSYLETKK